MRKIKINKDLIPFNRRQQTVFGLIVVCVFQFLLFFTPIIAAEVLAQEEDWQLSIGFNIKSEADPIVAAMIDNKNDKEIVDSVFIGPTNHVLPTNNEAEREVRVLSQSLRTITAYNSVPEQTNDQPCITANGFNVCEHWTEDTIAANFLTFGTKVRIPELFGDRVFIVRDRMNKRFSDRVDVWMKEIPDARQFGRRVAMIEIVEYID